MAAFDSRISDTFYNTTALVEATLSKVEQLYTPVVTEHDLNTFCPNTCTPGSQGTVSVSLASPFVNETPSETPCERIQI